MFLAFVQPQQKKGQPNQTQEKRDKLIIKRETN